MANMAEAGVVPREQPVDKPGDRIKPHTIRLFERFRNKITFMGVMESGDGKLEFVC